MRHYGLGGMLVVGTTVYLVLLGDIRSVQTFTWAHFGRVSSLDDLVLVCAIFALLFLLGAFLGDASRRAADAGWHPLIVPYLAIVGFMPVIRWPSMMASPVMFTLIWMVALLAWAGLIWGLLAWPSKPPGTDETDAGDQAGADQPTADRGKPAPTAGTTTARAP
ncbi:MAG: hypothetical protein ACFB3T_12620 [Geminicoccaceae bacterium]